MPIFQPHSHIQLPFIQPHQQHTHYLSPTTHTQQSPPTTLTKTYPTNQTTHNIINHHPLQTTLQSTPKYSPPHTTINPSINPPIFTTTHYKQPTNQTTNQHPKYSPPHTTHFHTNHTHQSIPPTSPDTTHFHINHTLISTTTHHNQPINQRPKYSPDTTPDTQPAHTTTMHQSNLHTQPNSSSIPRVHIYAQGGFTHTQTPLISISPLLNPHYPTLFSHQIHNPIHFKTHLQMILKHYRISPNSQNTPQNLMPTLFADLAAPK